MFNKKISMVRCMVILFVAVALSGCAFGNFGKANMSYSEINVPAGLNGQGKADVIKLMGIPDSVAQAGNIEYWCYNNKAGYFVLLFGKTIAKDVVVEFQGGKASSSYLVDKGSSFGILAGQGAVSE